MLITVVVVVVRMMMMMMTMMVNKKNSLYHLLDSKWGLDIMACIHADTLG